MNALTAALKEELNVDMVTVFGLSIPESVVVSWGIMAFLVIGSILLTRNLRVDHITKRQAILETVVTTINDFFVGLLGESGKRYVPYLMSVALYIGCSNLIGVFGIKPPTKDLNVSCSDEHLPDRVCRHPCTRRRWLPQEPGCPHPHHGPHERAGGGHPAHQPVHATVRQRAGRFCHYGADQAGGACVRACHLQLVF